MVPIIYFKGEDRHGISVEIDYAIGNLNPFSPMLVIKETAEALGS